MKLDALDQETLVKFYRHASYFTRADDVAVPVGLVLSFVLFGGLGGFILYYFPRPANYWVGGPIIGSGVLLIFFIGYYRLIMKIRAPFVLEGSLSEFVDRRSELGDRAVHIKLKITSAWELKPEGRGKPMNRLIKKERKMLLTRASLLDSLNEAPESLMLICVPTGQVVGYYLNGELIE